MNLRFCPTKKIKVETSKSQGIEYAKSFYKHVILHLAQPIRETLVRFCCMSKRAYAELPSTKIHHRSNYQQKCCVLRTDFSRNPLDNNSLFFEAGILQNLVNKSHKPRSFNEMTC